LKNGGFNIFFVLSMLTDINLGFLQRGFHVQLSRADFRAGLGNGWQYRKPRGH